MQKPKELKPEPKSQELKEIVAKILAKLQNIPNLFSPKIPYFQLENQADLLENNLAKNGLNESKISNPDLRILEPEKKLEPNPSLQLNSQISNLVTKAKAQSLVYLQKVLSFAPKTEALPSQNSQRETENLDLPSYSKQISENAQNLELIYSQVSKKVENIAQSSSLKPVIEALELKLASPRPDLTSLSQNEQVGQDFVAAQEKKPITQLLSNFFTKNSPDLGQNLQGILAQPELLFPVSPSEAARLSAQNSYANNTSQANTSVKVENVNVQTQATDAKAMAAGASRALEQDLASALTNLANSGVITK